MNPIVNQSWRRRKLVAQRHVAPLLVAHTQDVNILRHTRAISSAISVCTLARNLSCVSGMIVNTRQQGSPLLLGTIESILGRSHLCVWWKDVLMHLLTRTIFLGTPRSTSEIPRQSSLLSIPYDCTIDVYTNRVWSELKLFIIIYII